MSTHVIILAQGTQQRMGDIRTPKQLLPLPACNATPILHRTFTQLVNLPWKTGGDPPGESLPFDFMNDQITIVGWSEVFVHLQHGSRAPVGHDRVRDILFTPRGISLPDPGNSSLKGIARYLQHYPESANFDRTIVLLGDVVYSWACLAALFAGLREIDGVRFVGSSDISPSGGELWGLVWLKNHHSMMMGWLDAALANHPPFTTYQPGQLRRWMWAIHPSFHTSYRYTAIDDYTMDVDLPEHIVKLGAVSDICAADDRAHGVVWHG